MGSSGSHVGPSSVTSTLPPRAARRPTVTTSQQFLRLHTFIIFHHLLLSSLLIEDPEGNMMRSLQWHPCLSVPHKPIASNRDPPFVDRFWHYHDRRSRRGVAAPGSPVLWRSRTISGLLPPRNPNADSKPDAVSASAAGQQHRSIRPQRARHWPRDRSGGAAARSWHARAP